jgi:hypothetical protein
VANASSGVPARVGGWRDRGALHYVAATVLILLLLKGFRPEPPVTFVVPDGWTDLSPGTSPGNAEMLPEELRAEVRRGKYAAAAFGPVESGQPYTQTFTAVVVPRLFRGESERASLEQQIVDGMRTLGATARPQRGEVQKVGGVDALRLELRVSIDDVGIEERRVFWAIPAGRRTALLSYTCEESACDRLLPIMDASARGTRGIAAPSFLARLGIGRRVEEGATQVLGGLALIVVAVLRWKGTRSARGKAAEGEPRS